MRPAIELHGIGKSFAIARGAQGLGEIGYALQRCLRRRAPERFMALQDVSCTIDPGQCVGLLGHNGAGKSTLLKIIAQILHPSSGSMVLRGRLGAMLEVGTGFHPDLSGRENIYLSGAILGLSRAEIRRRLASIIEFSGVEAFLDLPVKRYSSGMYARLAFAVAAHLDPEILIIDEVLAVGDAAFQQRCLERMREAARDGRTVLFVSHNLQAVRSLCDRVLVFDHGRLVFDGATEDGLRHYLDRLDGGEQLGYGPELAALPEDPDFAWLGFRVEQDGRASRRVRSDRPVDITMTYRVKRATPGLRVFVDLFDGLGALIVRSFHDQDARDIPVIEPGVYVSRCTIPADQLGPMDYVLVGRAAIYNERTIPGLPAFLGPGLPVRIQAENTGRTNQAYPMQRFYALLAPVWPWHTQRQ